jgi:hypothetical protein
MINWLHVRVGQDMCLILLGAAQGGGSKRAVEPMRSKCPSKRGSHSLKQFVFHGTKQARLMIIYLNLVRCCEFVELYISET